MRKNLLIIFRVIYDPRHVFGEFIPRPKYVALAPVVAISLLNAVRAYFRLPDELSAGLTAAVIGGTAAFLYSACGMLLSPLVTTVYVYLLRARMGNAAVGFPSLLTAFILCQLPLYLGILAGSLSERFFFSLGDVFRFAADSHRGIFIVLATITPFFLWTVALWWIAVSVLLRARSFQKLPIIGSIALLHVLTVEGMNQALGTFLNAFR